MKSMKNLDINLNVFDCAPYKKRYIFSHLKYFLKNIKYAWQRATKGYCDRDLWNLDIFYLNLFINTLTNFKKNLHGAPSEFFDKEKENQVERWENYLKEMIEHFKNAQYDFNGPDGEGRSVDFLNQELKKGLDMMYEVFYELWD